MNTMRSDVIHEIRPAAVIAIAAVLAASLAVIAPLVAQIDPTGGGIFAGIGDYLAKVGEALGGG
jgi:hypothetical protein